MRSVQLGLITVFLTLSGLLPAKPDTQKRAEIPDRYKWDLSDIYPDWDSWEKDLSRLEQMMDTFAGLEGTLKQGPPQLLSAQRLNDDLNMLSYKVYRYPQLTRDTDTRDNTVSAQLQRVQILFARFGTATAWFNPEILTIPWETMAGWLDSEQDLAPYRFNLENLYRQQEHVLDEKGEKLLSYFSQFNGTPRAIFSELSTSDIVFPDIALTDGSSVTVTPGQYRLILATNRNQADRARAFEAFYGNYNQKINTYASIYNAVCQKDWAAAQARNYSSTLAAALDDDNVPVEVYKNLVAMVRAGTAPLKKYHALRKQALGLESYHLYDSSLPLVDFDRRYEYDDIQELIVVAMEPLGKDYQRKLQGAFEGGWVDVHENEGKRTGAYSAGVYGVHPYMLLNYADTMDDVFTVAHEMGHTLHTLLSHENQPFATSDYTIFVAEVASTMNEALLLDHWLNKTTDPRERIALLTHALDNITGTFYTQVMFADFELQVHRLVEEGKPITKAVLNDLYFNLLKEYYGGPVDIDDLYHIVWARIPHFYNSPYYVYQYATCFASSAKLHRDITTNGRRDRKKALEAYLTLLKSGGDDYPMEQLKRAGVDLSQPATIQAVVDQLEFLVNNLEKELNKL